jgi:hypothetical protein
MIGPWGQCCKTFYLCNLWICVIRSSVWPLKVFRARVFIIIHTSLLRKFVNYGRKKFYMIGPWMRVMSPNPLILTRMKSSFTPFSNKLVWRNKSSKIMKTVSCGQFYKQFTAVTYSHSKINCIVHWASAPMQCFHKLIFLCRQITWVNVYEIETCGQFKNILQL